MNAALQYILNAFSVISFFNVGGVLTDFFSCALRQMMSLLVMLLMSMLVLPPFASTSSIGKFFPSGFSILFVVHKRDSALEAYCSTPVR